MVARSLDARNLCLRRRRCAEPYDRYVAICQSSAIGSRGACRNFGGSYRVLLQSAQKKAMWRWLILDRGGWDEDADLSSNSGQCTYVQARFADLFDGHSTVGGVLVSD
jgi:hypothetical protein